MNKNKANMDKIIRICSHPGCREKGLYKAPISRNKPGYIYFCLKHIRAYNASWDYFEGFSSQEIENEIKKSTLWDRPTWPFSSKESRQKAKEKARQNGDKKAKRVLPMSVLRALKVIGLSQDAAWEDIRHEYRVRVKMYHPDARGGQKDKMEKFLALQDAFSILEDYYTNKQNKKSA